MPRNSDQIKRSKPNADNITAAAEAVLKDGVLERIAARQFGVNFKNHMLKGAPPGNVGAGHISRCLLNYNVE
ncbi:hypothetical protein TNCT_411761 [Trichonephila clavata]|uniref:Uncharacterized protein n=1 Tax=Trichonephila clavata TaxID=2740835 RepID=A0A8X6JKJ2_TRICU|nr:hypothetical protein TNCT_411761 [Trichonephila clavata]